MRATEIVLHFDKREIEALQNALNCFSDESCTVEQKLREAFDSLYTELVPPEMQNAIEMEILKESIAQQEQTEADKYEQPCGYEQSDSPVADEVGEHGAQYGSCDAKDYPNEDEQQKKEYYPAENLGKILGKGQLDLIDSEVNVAFNGGKELLQRVGVGILLFHRIYRDSSSVC